MKKSAIVVIGLFVLFEASVWIGAAAQWNPVTAAPVEKDYFGPPTVEVPFSDAEDPPLVMDPLIVKARPPEKRSTLRRMPTPRRIVCWRHRDDSGVVACGYDGDPANPREAVGEGQVTWR